MYSPNLVRKILFDVFQQLTQDDVQAANFFIRSETSKRCKNIYDLMDTLEKLAYFHVSKNKVKFGRLLELFENINRVDLQKTLLTFAEDLGCNNGNDFSASVSSSGDDETERSAKSSESDEEEEEDKTKSKGNNGNHPRASASLFEDEDERKSSKHSESEKKEKTKLNEGQDIADPSVSAASNPAEDKTEDCEAQLRTNTELDELALDYYQLSLDPQVVADTTINEQSDPSSDDESNTSMNSEASSPESIVLHNYQYELAEKGKTGVNSIICSPTGSGKTITAASIIKHNLEEATDRDTPYRVLYLVHIRYLVKHLAIDLKKILRHDVYPLDDNDLLTNEIVRSQPVVILTAQILDNALNNKQVTLSQYDLLVFDECHNTVHNHPFNEIMKKYHEMKRAEKRVPQIVGLSATLGGGHDPFSAIVKLCANLYTLWVSSVRDEDNMKELLEKNKAPIVDETITCKSRVENEFFQRISSAMKNFITELELEFNILFGNFNQVGTQGMESFLSLQKKACEKNKARIAVKIIQFLMIMNKALIYFHELKASDAYEYLEEKFPQPDSSDQDIEKKIASVYEMTMDNIKMLAVNDELENNEKLLKLKELLMEILKPNPEKKVILLCHTRFNTVHLKDIIMDDPELQGFVKADYIIRGLTQNQQADVLSRFENTQLNLLIATSIAEQGLNIPDCEIVIRYLYVTSDISRRQAQGRARKENSKCYLIVEENNDQITRDYRNKQREKEMDAAAVKVTEMGEEKFAEEVSKEIKELHDIADFNKRCEDSHTYEYKSEDIDILCKECHNVLCCGSDIIIRGTEYLCDNPDIASKVRIIDQPERVFREDKLIGSFQCNADKNCKNKFGSIKKYHCGNRQRGYVLNAQSILLEVRGTSIKSPLKKWSKHPFPIKKEFPN